ncbi:MAG: hypothetical protein N3B18_08130 [Desulfobacterota bacterium]|nr:hypothetical protein [Thermodesulfobacteriota bacterium]
MPLTAADYIRQSRITATLLDKSKTASIPKAEQQPGSQFSEILTQVQGGYNSVAKVGKKCLAYANPITHLGALYRIAVAGLHPKIETDDDLPCDGISSSYESMSPLCESDVIDTIQEEAVREGTFFEGGSDRLGSIAARYESGTLGSEAIGYDRNGGTSYGMYQLSSRMGTMARFIEYLQEHAPEWAQRLCACGPANTGSTNGRMPSEWKKIAKEDPQRLAQLEHAFIRETHYDEALAQVQERTGIDLSQRSAALREVLWSTAVQHGARGAADIVTRALMRAKHSDGTISDEKLIHEIYSCRSRQFTSSTRRVRTAVQQRFSEEKRVVLAMLKNGKDIQSV